MYSETNRRASVRRSNDEFLRRMIGGELGEIDPRLEKPADAPVDAMGESRISCDGTVSGGEDCPMYVKTPSLAVAYAPRQCWQRLLTPEAALAQGTLFEELVFPFERGQKNRETEGHSAR